MSEPIATFKSDVPHGPLGTAADDAVDRAVASGGDLVLAFTGRIGALPYFQFTPYVNNDGVRCHHWTCLSVTARAMPGRALLFRPTLVEADEQYPVRHFSTEWVRAEARKSWSIAVFDADDTPFACGSYRYVRFVDGGDGDE